MKLGYGLKARSHRVVQDSSVTVVAEPEVEIDGSKECSSSSSSSSSSCWANLPQELLREVLVRIEASESSWPSRRSVVACGGVCRTWREIMKELVRTTEVSGKFTFPISVKQPGPREPLIQCFIKRNPYAQMYHLYLNLTHALADNGKFLLAARKLRRPTCTDYNISLHRGDMSKGSSNYVGRLRSNFLGTRFIIYDVLPPHAGVKMMKRCSTSFVGSKQVSPRIPAGNYPIAHISYELNVLGSSWWLLQRTDRRAQNMRRSSSSLGKLGKMCSPWITGTRYLHFRHLLSVLAASTPRSLVNNELTVKPFSSYGIKSDSEEIKCSFMVDCHSIGSFYLPLPRSCYLVNDDLAFLCVFSLLRCELSCWERRRKLDEEEGSK